MVERKTTILTLSNLPIEVKGSRLSSTATDLELSSHLVRSEPKKQGAGTVSQRKYAAPQRRGTRSGYHIATETNIRPGPCTDKWTTSVSFVIPRQTSEMALVGCEANHSLLLGFRPA